MLLVAAAMLSGRTATATPTPGELSLSTSVMVWLPSDYEETLRAFDRTPLGPGFLLDFRVLRPLSPQSRLGGRVGWVTTESTRADTTAGFNTASSLRYHLFDAGAVYRYVWLRAPQGQGMRVHWDVEAGLVVGSATMLGVAQRWVSPRLATAVFLGRQWTPQSLYFGVRVGMQYVPWDGAGGSAFDPAFAAFHVGLEGGILP